MTGVSAAGTISLTIRAPPGERSTILHEASRLSLGTKKRPAISTRARMKWRRSAFARSTTLLRSLVMASASDTARPLKCLPVSCRTGLVNARFTRLRNLQCFPRLSLPLPRTSGLGYRAQHPKTAEGACRPLKWIAPFQEFRMGRAVASSFRPRIAALLGLCAAISLSGCIGNSVFDDLNAAQPVGSPFSEALFKNYAFLARSFGTQSSPSGQAFDAEGAVSLTGADNTVSGLADAYALKALTIAKGDEEVL